MPEEKTYNLSLHGRGTRGAMWDKPGGGTIFVPFYPDVIAVAEADVPTGFAASVGAIKEEVVEE